jgi:hypothetical protein
MIKLEWDQERWVKVYVRDSGDFAMLSWDAKALLLMLWRKADPLGVVRSAARCLPAFLGHRENAAQIEQGLADLEAIGAVEVRPDSLRLLEFVDAQSAVLCDRVRQAARRDRKAVSGNTLESQNVTESHAMSRDVTHGHAASRDVTTRQDQTRQEESRSDQTPTVEPPALQPDPKPQADAIASAGFPESQPIGPQDAKAPKPTRKPDPIPNIALGLFAELQAARKRCNPNIPNTDITAKGATDEIQRCLRDGLTVDQLRHVIAIWEALVKAGKRNFEHFNSVTPFRASNVHAYIQMPLETAKSSPTDPRKSPADLAREADNKAYFAELRGKLGAIDVPSVPSQPQIEGDYE